LERIEKVKEETGQGIEVGKIKEWNEKDKIGNLQDPYDKL